MKRIFTLRYLCFAILCALCTSIILSIITLSQSTFSLIGTLYLTFFYLIFSLIFAAPVQFVLNVKPKRFNILYLLIYAIVAFIATAFAMILLGEKPFSMLSHYIFSSLAAILFWFFDSILLQKE